MLEEKRKIKKKLKKRNKKTTTRNKKNKNLLEIFKNVYQRNKKKYFR